MKTDCELNNLTSKSIELSLFTVFASIISISDKVSDRATKILVLKIERAQHDPKEFEFDVLSTF